MIERFEAKNYGCLREVSLELTPFHALIGPNDSGKSTILRGIRTVGEIASGTVSQATFEAGMPPNERAARSARLPVVLGVKVPAAPPNTALGDTVYAITVTADGVEQRLESSGAKSSFGASWSWNAGRLNAEQFSIVSGAASARLARFDPDALRAPSGLIPQSNAVAFLDERGLGLPGVLQSIQGRYYDTFQSINEQVRRLFPTIKYVQVVPRTSSELVIEVELTDGVRVPASQVSEGLLYFLAFSAIPYLARAPILLVEEPENGLHPSRIAQVIHLLREFGKQTATQIILSTHSPLVVNELSPEEVTIVTRPSVETGTVVTPIRKTKNFEKRKSTYALGELWLSYADGNLESELVDSPE